MEYWIMESLNSSVLQDGEEKYLSYRALAHLFYGLKPDLLLYFIPAQKGRAILKYGSHTTSDQR